MLVMMNSSWFHSGLFENKRTAIRLYLIARSSRLTSTTTSSKKPQTGPDRSRMVGSLTRDMEQDDAPMKISELAHRKQKFSNLGMGS